MNLDHSDLTEAPLTEMLAACKGVLQEIGQGKIYERHMGGSKQADVTEFFKDLSMLSLEEQQVCFDRIAAFLIDRGTGVEHVANRLLKGKRDYLSELKN